MGGADIHLPALHGAQDDLFKSMFAPVAAEIGQTLATEFRRSREVQLSGGEADNLRHHTEKVIAASKPPNREPSRNQKRNLFEWIDSAAETDPDHSPEEAAKWQAVLAEILGGNDATSLDILKSLNIYDVRAIHSLSKSGGSLSDGQATRLVNLGMVEKRSALEHPLFMPFVVVGIILLFPVLNGTLIDLFLNSVQLGPRFSEANYRLIILTAAGGSFMLLAQAAIFWSRQARRVHFTEVGRDIKSKIDRFLSD